MLLKAAFKNSSFLVQMLLFLLVTIVIGFTLLIISFQVYLFAQTGKLPDPEQDLLSNPQYIRVMQFFQILFVFILPSLLLAYLFSDDKQAYLQTDTKFSVNTLLLGSLGMIVGMPFLNFLADLNSQIVFPDFLKGLEVWMKASEAEALQITESMMNTKSLWILLLNILIMGVLTGIGEEFIFRGVMQRIFRKLFKNQHVVIWVVAFIFSAVHFQFYGFIPRLLMGAYFGYLLLYTKCIWVPVFTHFVNNAAIVIMYFAFQNTDKIKDMDAIGTGSSWWLALVSLCMWGFVFMVIRKGSLKSSQND